MRRYEFILHGLEPHQFLIPNALSSKSITNIYCTAGTDPNRPTLVAIKGVVFDVTRNPAYGASGSYRGEYSIYFMNSITTRILTVLFS
jgi:hypothetical protein